MSELEPIPRIEANGAKIPLVGLGTWELRGRACARIVEQALRLGYRHVDTAEMYDNEREVGEGLRASGVKRGEVFVTTKIWPNHFTPRELERAARDCLARLRLSEVDLLLLHWPNPNVPLAETIGALCKVKRDGLARNIGVSNFTVTLIADALAVAHRAVGVRSGRVPSVPRPNEGACGMPQPWHGAGCLQPARPRRISPQRGAQPHRRRRTKRPRRKSACAIWCSRTSSSFRAPASSNG